MFRQTRWRYVIVEGPPRVRTNTRPLDPARARLIVTRSANGKRMSAPSTASDRPAARRFFQSRRQSHVVRFIAASALLILSALPIRRRSVSAFEVRVFHWINDLPSFLYNPVWAVMQLGNFFVIPVAALIAVVARRFRLALDIVLAGGAAWLLAKVLKAIVVRGRPAELLHDVVLRHAPAAGHGYVSGHAAVAVALATVLHPYLGPVGRKLAIVAALGVCFARVYVGAHLPLDVVGGAAMGWALGSLVHLLFGAPDRT